MPLHLKGTITSPFIVDTPPFPNFPYFPFLPRPQDKYYVTGNTFALGAWNLANALPLAKGVDGDWTGDAYITEGLGEEVGAGVLIIMIRCTI